MSLEGRYCTFSLSASSAVLYVKAITFETQSIAFTRTEKTHEKLAQAPESTGAQITRTQTLSGFPVQIIYGGATTARDFTPDDANLGLIEQKFFLNRYTVTGDTSLSADTGLMFTWAAQHKTLQDRFDAYQKYINDNVSYQELVTLGAETFSYLTTTGLSLSGSTLGTLQNLLVREFNCIPSHDIQGGPGAKVLYQWTGVFDQISIKSAASLS